jgi:hypothetical protein
MAQKHLYMFLNIIEVIAYQPDWEKVNVDEKFKLNNMWYATTFYFIEFMFEIGASS